MDVAVGCIFSSDKDAGAGLAASVVSSPLSGLDGGVTSLSPLLKRPLNAMVNAFLSNDSAVSGILARKLRLQKRGNHSSQTKKGSLAVECSEIEGFIIKRW